MSGSVWDKYKIPQDPSGNIPEADAVLPQRKPDDLPPAAQEKAEAEGRREAADKGLPKPAEVKPSGTPKYEKKVYTGGTDFKLERPDGTPIDVDLPKSPALIEDPDRPVRVYKAKEGQAIPYGSPAVADRLTESQRDIRDTAVPTAGVYGSPAIAEREARLADEKAAKAAEAERKAQAEKSKAAKPASTAASPALADKASEPSTGWRESPASARMKEEKYYPSPAQLTGFAVREAREKLTGKPLDVDGLMKRLEDAHRSFDNQLTYASPTTALDIYARRKKAVEDAVAAHATAVGSTNRRALEMEAASRGIPLASMIEQYETDDKSTPRASDIVEATKRRGVDIERLNRLDDIDINWASFSPQIFTSASTTGVLGNDETDKDVEIVKPGELGYEAALMVLNAVEEDGYNVGYITRLANERGGAQDWVKQRTADLTAGLTSADPQYDEKMGRAYQRAIAEIAAFKTVGLWASPIFMNDLIAPDYSKGLGERLWDAVKNQQEVIGYGPTSDPNKPRIIKRARSTPTTFFDAIDIPQQATVGFVEEIAKKGWDQADFAEGAVKGIEDKRDFMQAAVQSDWAKPTQVYDAFGQLKLDAEGNPVMEGEWKPLVAGGLGFTASVLFPDLTLYAGKAVGVGTDAYKGLRDGRRLAEATNLVDSVIALRSEGAATLRHAEEMNKKFRDAIASGASAAEVDKWRLAASDSRQLARAAFDEAAVQEAKLRSKYKMVAEDVDRMDAGVAADLAKDNPDIFNTRLAQAASQSDELLTLHPSMRRMKTKAPVVSDMRAKQPTELSTVDYEDLFNTSRIIGSIDQTLGETPSAEAVARVLRTTASNDVADIRRVIGDDDVAVQLLNDIEDTLPQAVADPKAWSRAILDRRNDLPSINPPDDAADAVKEAAKEKRKRLVRAVVNIYSKAKAAAKDASTDIRGRAIDAALTNNESRIAAASIMSERLRAMRGSKKSQLKNIQPDTTIDMALEKADYDASLTDGGLAFKKMLIEAGLPEKEAQVAAVVTDARARVASWKRGISTDEWYATRIEGVVKGDASKFTADTLYQESLTKNTDVSRLAVPEGFFSPLQRAIAKVIGDNNGRPVKSGYLLQQVKKQSGVKADELQWSGLEEFLAGKERVSIEEVTEWLTTREPVVEVRGVTVDPVYAKNLTNAADAAAAAHERLSTSRNTAKALKAELLAEAYAESRLKLKRMAAERDAIDNEASNDAYDSFAALSDEIARYRNRWDRLNANDAEYALFDIAKYIRKRADNTPVGGGFTNAHMAADAFLEDIRKSILSQPGAEERLMTWYDSYNDAVSVNSAAQTALMEARKSRGAPEYGRWVAPGPSENYREIRFIQPAIPSAGGDVYQHFEPNAIAHMRVTDRTTEDGKKVLFVEEVQSDWHQAGAKDGYAGTTTAPESLDSFYSEKNFPGDPPGAAAARRGVEETLADLQASLKGSGRQLQPATAMVATQPTTFRPIVLARDDSGRWHAVQRDFGGMKGTIRTVTGASAAEAATAYARHYPSTNLPLPGAHAETWRELALKQALIIAAREGYDGVAMTRGPIIARVAGGSGVGGELPGQLAFYEEILPNTAASLAKKNGSRLETTRLNVGAVVDDEKVKELRAAYKELSDIDDYFEANPPEAWRVDSATNASIDPRTPEQVEKGNRKSVLEHRIKQLIGEDRISRGPEVWTKTDNGVSNVPYIPVTDAMKAKVESEGLPLFSRDAAAARDEAFKRTQLAQRYGIGLDGVNPEQMATSGFLANAGGKLQHFLEHTGDLIHRAAMPSDKAAAGEGIGAGGARYGLEALREKTDRLLSKIQNLKEDGMAQVYRNADWLEEEGKLKYSKADYLAFVDQHMQRWADAFKRIPAHNELQRLSRDAAVALGEKRFDDLEAALKKIQEIVNGPDAEKRYNEVDGLASSLFSRDTVNTPAFKKWFGDSKVVDAEGRPLVVYHATEGDFDAFNTTPHEGALGSHFGDKETANQVSRASLGKGPVGTPAGAIIPVYLSVKNPLRVPDGDNTALGTLKKLVYAKSDNAQLKTAADKVFSTEEGKKLFAEYNNGDLDKYDLEEDVFNAAAEPQELKQRVIKALNAAGYDGLVYRNYQEGGRVVNDSYTVGDSYVVFSPEQVKSIHNSGAFNPQDPRLLYSRDVNLPFSKRNPFSVSDVDKVVAAIADEVMTTHAQDFADDFTSVLNKAVKTRDEGIVNAVAEALETGRYTGKEAIARSADVFYGALDGKSRAVLTEMVDRARALITKAESKTNASLDAARGWKAGGVDELAKARTAKEAARVVATHAEDESLRVIALRLSDNIADDEAFSIVDSLGGTAQGVRRYASAANDVFKRGEVALAKGDDARHMRAETVVHELLHSATANQLLRYKTMVQKGATVGLSPEAVRACEQLNAQYAHVASYVRNNPKMFASSTVPYGLKNVDEFVAEAFSNPSFRELLKKVPSIGHSNKFRSVYDDFVAALRSLFGMSNVPASALDDVLEAATDLATTASAEIDKLRSVDRASIEKQLDDIQKANLEFARVAYAGSPTMLRDAKFLFTRDSYHNTALYSRDASTAARLLEGNAAAESLSKTLGASRKSLSEAQAIVERYPGIEVLAMERVEESRISAKTGEVTRTSHWRVVDNPGRMSPRAFMLRQKGTDRAWLVPNAVRLERLSDDFDFSALKNKAPTAQYGSVSSPATGKYDEAYREFITETRGTLSDDARAAEPPAGSVQPEAVPQPTRPIEPARTQPAPTDSSTKEPSPDYAPAQVPNPQPDARLAAAWASLERAKEENKRLSPTVAHSQRQTETRMPYTSAAPSVKVVLPNVQTTAVRLLEANSRAAAAKTEVDRLTDALDKAKKRNDVVKKAIEATKKSKIGPDKLRDSVVKLRAESVALKSDIETLGAQLKAAKESHAEASKAATVAKKADEAADKVVVKADKKGESVQVTQARTRLTAAKKEYNAAARQLAEAKIALADAVSSKAKPGDIKTLKLRVEAAAALEKAKGAVVESANNLLSKTLAGESKATPVTPTVQAASPTTVKVATGKPVTPTDATSAPLPAAHGTPMGGVAPAVATGQIDFSHDAFIDFTKKQPIFNVKDVAAEFKTNAGIAKKMVEDMMKRGDVVADAAEPGYYRRVKKAEPTTPPTTKTLDASTPSAEATTKMPVEVEEVDDAIDASRVAGSKAAQDAKVTAREVTHKPRGKFGLNDDVATVDAVLSVSDEAKHTGAQKLPRGAVTFAEDGRAIIHAFEGANVETIMHEVGHIMRRDLDADEVDDVVTWMRAQTGDNSLDIVDGRMVSDSGADAIVTAEEVFAEGFVGYLRTGIAPTNNLQRAFDYMKTWLREIYKAVRGFFPTSVSKETGAMFEKLLSVEKSEEAMRKAMASGIDPKATPNIIKRVYKELIGPTLPQAPKTMDELAKAARASGLDVDAAALDDMMKRHGKIDFPHPVAGKATYTDNDLRTFQATIERARSAAREEARLKQALSGAHEAIVEETPTEALRNRVAGDRMGSAMARAATATFIGLDADFDLRALPTNIRAYIKIGARIVEAAYADGVKLLQERSPEKFRAWLTGRPTKFHNGRNAISSGYDYAGAVRSNLQLAFSTLTDEARAGAKVAMASAEKGAPAFIPERLRKANALAVNQTLYASNSDFIKQLGEVLGIPSDGARNDPRPMETVLTGALHRYAHPSPDIDSYEAVDDFLDIIEDTYGPDKAARVGLLIAGHGAGHKAIQKYYNLGVTVNPEEAQVFQSWLHAEKMSDADRAKAKRTAEKFGLDPRFVPVSGQFGTIHVPEAARKRLAAAMAKPSQNSLHWLSSPNDIGRGIYKDDVKPWQWAYDGVGFFVRGLKAGMTRGNLLVSSWFNFANTIDRMNQVATKAGFGAALATMTRVLAQDMLIFTPLVSRAADVGRRFGVFDADAIEAMRRVLSEGGDRMAVAVQKMALANSCSISTNKVLDGVDETVNLGGRWYNYKDLRQVYIDQGVASSYAGELENAIRKSIRPPEGLVEKLGDRLASYMEYVEEMHEGLAERERVGAMLTFIEMGASPEDAAKLAVAALFDYGSSIAPAERSAFLALFFQFWAFQKNANMFTVNSLLTPWGAYRAGVIRRTWEGSTEALSELIYGSVADPYGVDTQALGDVGRANYYALRAEIEAFYGGSERVPDDVVLALRHLFGQLPAYMMKDGKIQQLSAKLQNVVTLTSGSDRRTDPLTGHPAMLEIGEAYVPKPDPSKRAGYNRDRPTIAVTFPKTENMKRYLSLAGDDHPYVELMLPEQTIVAGLRHTLNLLAATVLLPQKLIAWADGAYTDDGVEKMWHGMDETYIAGPLTQVMDPDRSILLPEIAADFFGGEDPPPYRIAPVIGELMADLGLPLVKTDAVTDPFALGTDASPEAVAENARLMGNPTWTGRPSSDKNVGIVSAPRYYVPGGVWATLCRRLSGFHDINKLLMSADESTLEGAAGLRGDLIVAASIALGIQEAESTGVKTAAREEPRKPDDALNPNK